MQDRPTPLSAEEEIHLQERLLNTVEQAILAVDLTGHVVFWNRFAERLYGWSFNDVLGLDISEVLKAPLLMALARKNMAKLENGGGWSGEFLVQRRDGTSFMTYISGSLIEVKKRVLISIVGISSEIIENPNLKEVNRLLAEASTRLIDSVDYQTSLTTLAQLVVPQLADWCAVHLLKTDGSFEQVALAPIEMKKLQVSYDWLQNFLPNDVKNGLPAVLTSGEPKLVTDVMPHIAGSVAAIKSYMIVPLIARPQTLGAITFVTAESGRRFDQNSLAVAENLASHISVYLDKSRLYRESQRLKEELEKRVEERTIELSTVVEQLKESENTVQTLFRISKKLNATLDVNTILDELAQEAIQIVNGESGFAGLRTSEGMTVRKYFDRGQAIPFEYVWPIGKGIPGWVLKYKIPYGTSDAANDPIISRKLSINTNIRSIICTPILDSEGEVLAYFDIRNKIDGEGFTISDQDMLMALAPAASIAIQNALAYQARMATLGELKESSVQLQALAANLELAREEERTQLARELHDQLGQALTAMKYDLAWLTDQLKIADVNLAKKTKAITAQMDAMIKTVRRISTELRPGMLDDLGLAASIEWQARDFEKRTGIVCEVSVPTEELSLDRAQSVALFRIFQESLTNILRHANAQNVEVTLSASDGTFSLQIHDDGRGILTREVAGLHSLGLLGMRERAKRLGGTFDIYGIPGDGTMVNVSIPVKKIE